MYRRDHESHPLIFRGNPAMLFKKRLSLRDRYLAEQQVQLVLDAKLLDPAEAYRLLLAELESEHEQDQDNATDKAA